MSSWYCSGDHLFGSRFWGHDSSPSVCSSLFEGPEHRECRKGRLLRLRHRAWKEFGCHWKWDTGRNDSPVVCQYWGLVAAQSSGSAQRGTDVQRKKLFIGMRSRGGIRIGEVDSKDANTFGSCWSSERLAGRRSKGGCDGCDVPMLGYPQWCSGRLEETNDHDVRNGSAEKKSDRATAKEAARKEDSSEAWDWRRQRQRDEPEGVTVSRGDER